jgi:integrase/recombinase XerD
MRAGLVAPPGAPVAVVPGRLTVATAIDKYLDFIEHHRSARTYLAYRYTLDTLLRNCCGSARVDDVSRDDILKFMTDCYKQGLGGCTVYDKLVVVLQMFKRFGRTKLIEASDWPDYVEKIRPIYSPEEIRALLHHAKDDEAIVLKFMLGSGFRDQEAQYLTWRDLDFDNSLVRVTAKQLFRFKPKNWEERAVPLPATLIDQLRELKEGRNALSAQLGLPQLQGPSQQRKRHDRKTRRRTGETQLRAMPHPPRQSLL